MKVVCGPIVRRTTTNSSSIWVELDSDCLVQASAVAILGPASPGRSSGWKPPQKNSIVRYTVKVGGRFFALVPLDGLEPGWVYRYFLYATPTEGRREPWHRTIVHFREQGQGAMFQIDLDGWAIGTRGPAFRTFPPAGNADTRIAFGSCRKADGGVAGPAAKGTDVLSLYASHLAKLDRLTQWPHLLLLLGDQIYADDVDRQVAAARWKTPGRRQLSTLDEPERALRRYGNQVPVAGSQGFHCTEFADFALAYVSSWTAANVAKVLANIPTFMTFDDHDITDDWNITGSWLEQMMQSNWWTDAVTDGLVAYWMYQGWGNPLPQAGVNDPRVALLTKGAETGKDVLDELRLWFGMHITPGAADYYYKIETTPPVLMLDTRHDRSFAVRPAGDHRSEKDEILGEKQWNWLVSNFQRDGPMILGMGVPFLQFLCVDWLTLRFTRASFLVSDDGMEVMVRDKDVDWWTAFPASFRRLAQVMVGKGPFILLSGDVHYSYGIYGRYALPATCNNGRSPLILQAVSSPLRNQWPDGHNYDPEMCTEVGVAGESADSLIKQAQVQTKSICSQANDVSWLRTFFPQPPAIFDDERQPGKKSRWTRFNNIGLLKVTKDQTTAKVQWFGAPAAGATELRELAFLESPPGTFLR
jgi:PhoD-like phosphatase